MSFVQLRLSLYLQLTPQVLNPGTIKQFSGWNPFPCSDHNLEIGAGSQKY
jgi:hypothetical protein